VVETDKIVKKHDIIFSQNKEDMVRPTCPCHRQYITIKSCGAPSIAIHVSPHHSSQVNLLILTYPHIF